LGDIVGFSDQFFDSGMGGISFFQMIYFTFVTISTVLLLHSFAFFRVCICIGV
jgi:hypothetical protein